jgi:serine/threonine protein kinase
MSPEQAELNQLDIDTRSDVYSLGVLRYKPLTGSTPLEKKPVKEVVMLEVLRLERSDNSQGTTLVSDVDGAQSGALGAGTPQRLPSWRKCSWIGQPWPRTTAGPLPTCWRKPTPIDDTREGLRPGKSQASVKRSPAAASPSNVRQRRAANWRARPGQSQDFSKKRDSAAKMLAL